MRFGRTLIRWFDSSTEFGERLMQRHRYSVTAILLGSAGICIASLFATSPYRSMHGAGRWENIIVGLLFAGVLCVFLKFSKYGHEEEERVRTYGDFGGLASEVEYLEREVFIEVALPRGRPATQTFGEAFGDMSVLAGETMQQYLHLLHSLQRALPPPPYPSTERFAETPELRDAREELVRCIPVHIEMLDVAHDMWGAQMLEERYVEFTIKYGFKRRVAIRRLQDHLRRLRERLSAPLTPDPERHEPWWRTGNLVSFEDARDMRRIFEELRRKKDDDTIVNAA